MILLCKKISLIIILLINITRSSSNVTCEGYWRFPKSSHETHLKSKSDIPGAYVIEYSNSLDNCKVDRVAIQINIVKDITKEQCSILNSNSTLLSSYKYNCHTSEDIFPRIKSCNVVNLEYNVTRMFQGCYGISVKIFNETNNTRKACGKKHLQEYVWVENNLTIDSVQFPSPLLSVVHMREYSKVSFHFNTSIENVPHLVEVGSNDVTNNCTRVTSKDIQCLLSLQKENNSVKLSFISPQCRCLNSDFFKYCSAVKSVDKTNIDEHNSNSGTATGSNFLSQILIGIICVMVLAVCLILLIIWKQRNREKEKLPNIWKTIPQSDSVTEDNISELSVTGIFLLYARDCEPFMDAMLQLQKYLFKATGLPVYNLFDNSQFNVISRSPYEWVERHIHDPKVRVVLVATRCSQLMYIELLERIAQPLSADMQNMTCLLYKRPHAMDCMVQHAIKLLSGNINSSSSYQKNFVCQLLNFPNDEDLLLQINPYKRYILPSLLSSLLDEMKCRQTINDTVDNEKIFIASFNHLSTYVESHPGYLSDLLKRTS